MLTNKDVFKKLMDLLRGIDPKNPLPAQLEEVLWQRMIVEEYCYKERDLEMQGEEPDKAYYVVSGKVKVYAWCPNGYRYLYRIYRENTIVAFQDFVTRDVSPYQIVACRNTRIWSISHVVMQEIYDAMPGMKEIALNTALKYSEAKEKLRNDLLALLPEERVLRFYRLFDGLLPARTGPVRDVDVAGFLVLSPVQLRDIRRALRSQGLL